MKTEKWLLALFAATAVSWAATASAGLSVRPVPEPSSLVLLATGAGGLAWWLRNRKK